MLTALASPTETSFLLPETVQARLGLAVGDLPILEQVIEEASGLAARYLRFQPAYGLWEETFTAHDQRGDKLYLGARPVWRVSGVTNISGTIEALTSYRLDTEAHALLRYGGWGYRTAAPWASIRNFTLGGYRDDAWDWTVEYEAGWWLETMSGNPPAGVGRLPAEIRRDFLGLCRWLWNGESRDGSIKRMRDEGAEVEFFGGSEVDSETGIPLSLVSGMATWRRPL